MRQTVYVVEGDWDIRCALGETLEDEGWRPALFGKGEDVLIGLDTNRPSFLVIDLHLPGMSGSDLLLALHSRPDWARVPTAVFTAWRDLAVPRHLNVPVIMKPDVAGLLALIRSVLALRSAPLDSRSVHQPGTTPSALLRAPSEGGLPVSIASAHGRLTARRL